MVGCELTEEQIEIYAKNRKTSDHISKKKFLCSALSEFSIVHEIGNEGHGHSFSTHFLPGPVHEKLCEHECREESRNDE